LRSLGTQSRAKPGGLCLAAGSEAPNRIARAGEQSLARLQRAQESSGAAGVQFDGAHCWRGVCRAKHRIGRNGLQLKASRRMGPHHRRGFGIGMAGMVSSIMQCRAKQWTGRIAMQCFAPQPPERIGSAGPQGLASHSNAPQWQERRDRLWLARQSAAVEWTGRTAWQRIVQQRSARDGNEVKRKARRAGQDSAQHWLAPRSMAWERMAGPGTQGTVQECMAMEGVERHCAARQWTGRSARQWIA